MLDASKEFYGRATVHDPSCSRKMSHLEQHNDPHGDTKCQEYLDGRVTPQREIEIEQVMEMEKIHSRSYAPDQKPKRKTLPSTNTALWLNLGSRYRILDVSCVCV